MVHQEPDASRYEQQPSGKMKVKKKQNADEYHCCLPGKVLLYTSEVEHIIRRNQKSNPEQDKEKPNTNTRMMLSAIFTIFIFTSHN
jgi:hypothetical protein